MRRGAAIVNIALLGGCALHTWSVTAWETPPPCPGEEDGQVCHVATTRTMNVYYGEGVPHATYDVVDPSRPFGVELCTAPGFEPLSAEIDCVAPLESPYHVAISSPEDAFICDAPSQYWKITFSRMEDVQGSCVARVSVLNTRRGRLDSVEKRGLYLGTAPACDCDLPRD